MSWKRRDVIFGTAGLLGAAMLPRGAAAARLEEIGGDAFGTTWRALIPSGENASALRSDIGETLKSLDAALSPFRTGSELTRLNDADHAIGLSEHLGHVVRQGLRIAHLTDGAFDPTVGPAVARYGFGQIRRPVGATGEPASYRDLAIRDRTLIKRRADATFDPCGIAKGYALDLIGQRLSARGINSFFAEFGGEVLVRGRHPSGRPWRAGIEDPTPGPVRSRLAINMNGGALATSGDRINAYEIGGRRYSHIVDPRTSAPVDNGVASVSVLAPTAMMADALATALMVMGPARGVTFAENMALPVLFVLRTQAGLLDVATAAFRATILG